MDDLERRLVRCFVAEFPRVTETEIPMVSMAAIKEWDSVATVTLVTLIEEEFGIQVDLEDVEHLTSFDQFLKCVRERTVARD